MGIIPKQGEAKESVGVLAVLIVHQLLGLGILVIGQRTKNVLEFWGGLAVFLFAIAFLVISFASGSAGPLFGYGLFSLATWLYILVRLVWIAVKKETRLTIL